jgi:hypothetical protein
MYLRAQARNTCMQQHFGYIFQTLFQHEVFKVCSFTATRYINHVFARYSGSSPSRRREAPCEGTNSPRLFTPGETKALAESKVHQISRAWVTNDGWSSSLISKIWRTVMNSGHWLVQFKVCIITTGTTTSRQRNSKHFLIWWLINFLQIYFIFARIFERFCKFQRLSQKETAKESAKRREPTLTKVSLF